MERTIIAPSEGLWKTAMGNLKVHAFVKAKAPFDTLFDIQTNISFRKVGKNKREMDRVFSSWVSLPLDSNTSRDIEIKTIDKFIWIQTAKCYLSRYETDAERKARLRGIRRPQSRSECGTCPGTTMISWVNRSSAPPCQ